MPILALIEDAYSPAVIPDASRSLDIQPLGGEVIGFGARSYVLTSGIQGLDLPPRSVEVDDVIGLDGGRLVSIRTLPRRVSIPMCVASEDARSDTFLALKARVARAMDYRAVDYAANEGTLDLIATRNGIARRLRCVYQDGMEGSLGHAHGEGLYWSTFDVGLLATSPYWRGEEWSTPLVGVASGEPFLSTDPGDGWPRMLSASVAIGEDMPVVVGGDVPSPPVIEIVGPATATSITSSSGMDVTVGAITAGQTFRLDTRRRVSPTLNDVQAWDLLASAPRFAPLSPGETMISVVAEGATSATLVRVWGDSLWESPW